MSSIVENIDMCIKNIGYDITLNSLLEIIIREYTTLNITLKITKNFISILENVVKYQHFGHIRLSNLISVQSSHFDISNEIPLHQIIHNETNVYVLNDIYLKLLNILIREKILFDYNKIYIENRTKLIKELSEQHDHYITIELQKSCKYMEGLILSYIGKINEIPQNYTINSNCSIGTYVDFCLRN
jgi:hypothetical protein